MPTHYIARRLTVDDTPASEQECLSRAASTIVVLAEPGAGKSDLLDSFARALGVTNIRASIFRHSIQLTLGPALVIDALDEVARQDKSALDAVIVKALELRATTTVLASRASEWGNERNRFIQDCTGRAPAIVRLHPFNEDEQRQLFESRFPGENFEAFRTQANKFGLAPILGNPMFLRLIVEGYIQAGRHLHSNRQIFKDAVDRLASDDGKSTGPAPRPPIEAIVATASTIFTELMLSGADGVASVERPGDRQFPYIASLVADVPTVWPSSLNSRLFKPAANTDNHEPVHRIVAEYCAASYLARRIAEPADALSLKRCLAVIAPSSVPRDDLRGLLGWLAALGNQTIQDATIALDPYAVIANGDPAQLSLASKKLLLSRLRSLSQTDPYFRRADAWRRFNAAELLTADVADDLRPILTSDDDGSHLRDLMLELLREAPAAASLAAELRGIMLDAGTDLSARLLAKRCLAHMSTYDPAQQDFGKLLTEATPQAFQIAAEFIADHPSRVIDPALLLALFRGLARPTPTTKPKLGRQTNLDTVRTVVETLDLQTATSLLDNLTNGLACTCGAKRRFQCHCRSNISKIVGILLDRIFEIAPPSLDPQRLWSWLRNLNFESDAYSGESCAVQALRQQVALRQSLQRLALEGQTDPEHIRRTLFTLQSGGIHQGLLLFAEDAETLLDYAFATDNGPLWIALVAAHNRYAKIKGPNALRRKNREQALIKPALMREWAKINRRWGRDASQYRYSSRRLKRNSSRDAAAKATNRAHLTANRALIEQGRHWGWTREFARNYLHFPDQLNDIEDGIATAERALDNCFEFLAPHIPSLADLAQRKGEALAEVLHAACLVRFRKSGTLADVDLNALRAAKTDQASTSTYPEGEFERFEMEIDARLFPTPAEIEQFARAFIEPTLADAITPPPNLWWLAGKRALEPVKAKLAAEWLETYPHAALQALRSLFDIATATCDRSCLIALIDRRCNYCLATARSTETADQTARRQFWFLRHFFFADHDRDGIWAAVLSHPDGIFTFERVRSIQNVPNNIGVWPTINVWPTCQQRVSGIFVYFEFPI